jgi:signal transduction histidine kinase
MFDINIQTILEMLSEIIGMEGAEKLIGSAITDAGVQRQLFYSEEDFKLICEKLKESGGTVKIFASLVQTSKYRENQYQRMIDREKKEKQDVRELYKKMEQLNSDLHISNEKLKEANESLKRVQKELLQTEKLATIGQLAATVAHELRNPLTTIKNAKYYLLKYIKSDNPKVNEILLLISSEIDRTNRIVSELLEFSQEKEYMKLHININELLEQTLATLHPEKITIIKEFADNLERVFVDQDKIKQAFLNLISNASDAMLNEGMLTIKTEACTSYEPGKDYVSISFTDTGCGISLENLPRVFDPLFTTKLKGIGLGLTIVRDIVKKHDGEVGVESEEGNGATVTILLPTHH